MPPTPPRKLDERTKRFTLLLGMPASRAEHSGPHLHSTHLRHLHDTFGRRDGLCMRATADFRKRCMVHALNSRKLRKKQKILRGGSWESNLGARKKTTKFRKFPQEKKAQNVNIQRFAKKSDAELQANAHSSCENRIRRRKSGPKGGGAKSRPAGRVDFGLKFFRRPGRTFFPEMALF